MDTILTTERQFLRRLIQRIQSRYPCRIIDEAILHKQLIVVPQGSRLETIAADHKTAVIGQMFFTEPNSFEQIIEQLADFQHRFNQYI